MIWALPLGMAALGYLQGEKKRKQEEAMARANIEANRFSPWTGRSMEVHAPTSSGFDSALQGGVSGAMLGQQFGGGAEVAKAAPVNTAPPAAGGSMLGNNYDFGVQTTGYGQQMPATVASQKSVDELLAESGMAMPKGRRYAMSSWGR